ncbi:hypothetical protein [Desulforamulus ferrireducens]|uniref:Uncharacterized protein n=1 Tax=Desulforamulus ferrireducens TaxID=1833852 RepID=A0A1S6IYG0_9FIRM|nr:hypothetical protein [Desulforamulus ferrireducens]AQS59796.1 hypothetical protein B0537_12330 [Desulforamulus ferrireducens]
MAKAVLLTKAGNLHPLSILDRLTKDFIQEDFIFSHGFTNFDILLNRMNTLSATSKGNMLPVLTMYPGGDCSFINTLKEKSNLLTEIKDDEQPTLSLLKEVILPGILGLNQADQAEAVSYSEDLPAALQAVEDGRYALAFIIL